MRMSNIAWNLVGRGTPLLIAYPKEYWADIWPLEKGCDSRQVGRQSRRADCYCVGEVVGRLVIKKTRTSLEK